MSGLIKNYKKELNSLKINKFDFLKHKIDKEKFIEAYTNYENTIKKACENEDVLIEDLIKYETWLEGED